MTRRDRPCEAERAMPAKAIAAYVLRSHLERCSRSTRGWCGRQGGDGRLLPLSSAAAADHEWRRGTLPQALGLPRLALHGWE